MKIYTSDFLDAVEKRDFKIEFDEKSNEIINWLKTVGEEELKTQEGIEKADLLKYLLIVTKKYKVYDNLEKYLTESSSNTFYYVGINQFVIDYYNKNPNTEWKLKAVLQFGFPFDFAESKNENKSSKLDNFLIKAFLDDKKWSIFVFTKEEVSTVTIGFDDRNTYANLSSNRRQLHPYYLDRIKELSDNYAGGPFLVWDSDNDDHDIIVTEFLEKEQAPLLSNAEYSELKYSFAEVPAEYFRIDYLDYISRYKKSVVDVFGYPDKNEKIKKLKDVVEFVNAPNKKHVYSTYEARKQNVLIGDFYYQNQHLKPTVRIGHQDYYIYEQYEIHSYLKSISPYYLYCLLTSELVIDYYSERYSIDRYDEYGTTLPLEDCIYIEMSPDKMQNRKYADIYERDINPRLKARDMIRSVNFATGDAQKTIEKYLVEIKNNIDHGSYYSATIVMGSVLEAFLIDWLSEIDGKNYFKEDYLVTDQKYHYRKRADLIDYINIIQKKHPDWIEGADKATEIRKKRNLVHARLYIEEGEITKDVCYEMLNNLETIINNRWPKK